MAFNFKNILYNTYLFQTRSQKPEEPLQQFITDLTNLAKLCDFTQLEFERRVRDQIIVGIKDNNLRGALFTLNNPKLSEVLEFLKTNFSDNINNPTLVNNSLSGM